MNIRKYRFVGILAMVIALGALFRIEIYCALYPGIANTFLRKVKINVIEMKPSYFWVFDKKHLNDDKTYYGGFHYWYGYFADIDIYASDNIALHEFSHLSGPYFFSAKTDSFFWVHKQSESCFTYGYRQAGNEYLKEILFNHGRIIIRLTQTTNQTKYMKEKLAVKLVNDFF
jgi:hypothetical protein